MKIKIATSVASFSLIWFIVSSAYFSDKIDNAFVLQQNVFLEESEVVSILKSVSSLDIFVALRSNYTLSILSLVRSSVIGEKFLEPQDSYIISSRLKQLRVSRNFMKLDERSVARQSIFFTVNTFKTIFLSSIFIRYLYVFCNPLLYFFLKLFYVETFKLFWTKTFSSRMGICKIKLNDLECLFLEN